MRICFEKLGVFANSVIRPVLELCAVCGWWKLARAVLEDVAASLGVPTSGSLLDLLLAITIKGLGCTEQEAMNYLAARLSQCKRGEHVASELLQVDEAVSCLTTDDKKAFDREKEKFETDCHNQRQFRAEYRARVEHRRMAPLAKAKAAAKAAACPIRAYHGPKVFPDAPTHEDQAVAKTMCPPGALVWRSTGSDSWNTRYLDHRPCTRSWNKYGSTGSLRLVLLDAWEKFSDRQGVGYSKIPISGLYEHP